MSGLKEQELAHFLRLIRNRLGGAGVLAEFAQIGRSHLSSMLHGDSDRGVYTWGKVRRHVTAVEWSFLEQCSAWNSFQARYPDHAANVKRVPVCDSPDNPLMPVVCGECYKALKTKKCEPSRGGIVSHGLCTEHFVAQMRSLEVPQAEIDRLIKKDAETDRADVTITLIGQPEPIEPELFSVPLPAATSHGQTIMNTNLTTEILLSAVEVAKATGIEVHDLPALHPEYFGVPGHWHLNKHSVVVYTAAGVSGLADVLDAQGKAAQAHSLRVALKQALETPSRRLIEQRPKDDLWYGKGQMG